MKYEDLTFEEVYKLYSVVAAYFVLKKGIEYFYKLQGLKNNPSETLSIPEDAQQELPFT